jgi:hypothetical protein
MVNRETVPAGLTIQARDMKIQGTKTQRENCLVDITSNYPEVNILPFFLKVISSVFTNFLIEHFQINANMSTLKFLFKTHVY